MPRYPASGRYGPGPGWGRGRFGGFGRGAGRGWCYWPQRPWCRGWGGWGPPPWMFAPDKPEPFWSPYGPWLYWEEPPYEDPEEEIRALKEEEVNLKNELQAIRKRLVELQPEGSSS
jgi:hypothetical protein